MRAAIVALSLALASPAASQTAQDYVDQIRTLCAVKHASIAAQNRCGERQVADLLFFKKLRSQGIPKRKVDIVLACWAEHTNRYLRDWTAARACYVRRTR